jgi:murein DD-endopeptidase MepM/ murein hydrolase activator NlpD
MLQQVFAGGESAVARRRSLRLNRAREAIVAAFGGAAMLVFAAATAVPSSRQVNRLHAAGLAPHPAAPVLSAAMPADARAEAISQPPARRFAGRVGPDLSRSLLASGVPEAQGREYVALLGRAIPLADGLSVDDRFDLVLERRADGSLGQLLYAGMDRVARADVELLKWTDGRSVIWVNADGVGGDGSAGMRMPVGGRVTSPFGERFHPILGYERFHAGVDLRAAAGTPIVAAADGRVVSAGWRGGYGRAVAIAHSGGLESRYGHMSRIAAYPGELVHRGQLIGYVGSTGLSTGPHLHFEVTRNGRPVNPLSVKMDGAPGHLEGAKLQAFQDELRQLLLVGADAPQG